MLEVMLEVMVEVMLEVLGLAALCSRECPICCVSEPLGH